MTDHTQKLSMNSRSRRGSEQKSDASYEWKKVNVGEKKKIMANDWKNRETRNNQIEIVVITGS